MRMCAICVLVLVLDKDLRDNGLIKYDMFTIRNEEIYCVYLYNKVHVIYIIVKICLFVCEMSHKN